MQWNKCSKLWNTKKIFLKGTSHLGPHHLPVKCKCFLVIPSDIKVIFFMHTITLGWGGLAWGGAGWLGVGM
jgi:hypothetical protein